MTKNQFQSLKLYKLVLMAISCEVVRRYESWDLADEVSFKEMFRIKDSS